MTSNKPVWDPVNQVYVGAVLPENNAAVQQALDTDGSLRIFGYGSLCWNPGTGPLAQATKSLGQVHGYRRCWAQSSADHRGVPTFPGIVCTLLKDEELGESESSVTAGMIYRVPAELVTECLADLDFREKGGYARDIITVLDVESGKSFPALLYRGTIDNPAIIKRVLHDLHYAAAIMSVAVGPSGDNHVYLSQLAEFLASHEVATDDRGYSVDFLVGAGSNQFNQLKLKGDTVDLVNGDEAHQLKGFALCTPTRTGDSVKEVLAGGGFSGMLTHHGLLYLWGNNDCGQCGPSIEESVSDSIDVVMSVELPKAVTSASLGFAHTLVIDVDGTVFGFGGNAQGQVDDSNKDPCVHTPTTPLCLKGRACTHVFAGVFHSAAITAEGDLVVFGRQNSLPQMSEITGSCGVWKPEDGAKVVQVACGQKHTVAVDDRGRIWTFGDNSKGQLGRDVERQDQSPKCVQLPSSFSEMDVVRVDCGWSHSIVHLKDAEGKTVICGWGRSDKGQLGVVQNMPRAPSHIFSSFEDIQHVACGSESTVLTDKKDGIWSCGWNEHGNLASGNSRDSAEPLRAEGDYVTSQPTFSGSRMVMAVGGAHIIATRVTTSP